MTILQIIGFRVSSPLKIPKISKETLELTWERHYDGYKVDRVTAGLNFLAGSHKVCSSGNYANLVNWYVLTGEMFTILL